VISIITVVSNLQTGALKELHSEEITTAILNLKASVHTEMGAFRQAKCRSVDQRQLRIKQVPQCEIQPVWYIVSLVYS
jgi:hypothetical protein